MFIVDKTRNISTIAESIIAGEKSLIANMANLCSIIFHYYEDLNWAGFYLFDGKELVLGPFQGLPACIRIPLGKGVCGRAAQTNQIQNIDNVHKFDGHIACDSASNSELVIPIFKNDKLIGVLDIDSTKFDRFNLEIAYELNKCIEHLLSHSEIN